MIINRTEMNSVIDLDTTYGGKKVMVLGASGFIGRWVARLLCKHGAQVYLFVRNPPAAEKIFSDYNIRGIIVESNLEQSFMTFLNQFQKIKPSITFNLAGYGVDRSERDQATTRLLNTELVEKLCDAVSGSIDTGWSGQNLVHTGSALEYGEISGDLSESSSPHPTTLYGQTKLAGTTLLQKACTSGILKGVTARLFTVYGPGEHNGRLLPALIDAANSGKPLQLTEGLQKRDFTYIGDVAEGLLILGACGKSGGGIINLATGKLTSVRNFTEKAAKTLSIPTEKLEFGALPTMAEEMEHSPVNISNLEEIVGWVPQTTIEEGVLKTIGFISDLN